MWISHGTMSYITSIYSVLHQCGATVFCRKIGCVDTYSPGNAVIISSRQSPYKSAIIKISPSIPCVSVSPFHFTILSERPFEEELAPIGYRPL